MSCFAEFSQSIQSTKCHRAVSGTTTRLLTDLENRIQKIVGNKKALLNLSSCGENCFQINSSLTNQPRIIQIDSDIDLPTRKGSLLTIPPPDRMDPLVLDSEIRRLLIGHELHPYISPLVTRGV